MPGAGNPGLALQDALGLLCCLCAEAAAKGLETEDPMEDESFKAVDAAVVAPLQVSVGGKGGGWSVGTAGLAVDEAVAAKCHEDSLCMVRSCGAVSA